MSRHYPCQQDDIGCFAFIGCLICALLILLTLVRAISWLWGALL